ncbi:hypothetical protein KFE25_011196 [Diacronema lutheri]|uniref:Uncharacterized protein n=1 Tax=Diacronema lutheri TaxID=2081491 RepID=A0A8J5XEQ7_DIALT|nr:hypothetical protein KFE25_011196 [Diacronema lutheri]
MCIVWAAIAPELYAERRGGSWSLLDPSEQPETPLISPLALLVHPDAHGLVTYRVRRSRPGVRGAPVPEPPRAPTCPPPGPEMAARSGGELERTRLRPGSHVFVHMPGEPFLRVGAASGKFGHMCGHLVLSAGAPVLFAGELEVGEDGTLVRWSNKSGSYRPSAWAAGVTRLDATRFVPFEPPRPPASSGAPAAADEQPSADDAVEAALRASSPTAARSTNTADAGAATPRARERSTRRHARAHDGARTAEPDQAPGAAPPASVGSSLLPDAHALCPKPHALPANFANPAHALDQQPRPALARPRTGAFGVRARFGLRGVGARQGDGGGTRLALARSLAGELCMQFSGRAPPRAAARTPRGSGT